MKRPAAADEKAAASAVPAEAEPSFPWSPEGRKDYPGSEERTENWRKHYASLQKYYANSCGLEQSQILERSEEMATLSEAHALQQEAGEEEAHTADEMVEAAPPEAPQTKSSQDGVEAMEGHVKLEASAEGGQKGLATKPGPEEKQEQGELEPERAQERLEKKPTRSYEGLEARPPGNKERLETEPAGDQDGLETQPAGDQDGPETTPAEKKDGLETKPAEKKKGLEKKPTGSRPDQSLPQARKKPEKKSPKKQKKVQKAAKKEKESVKLVAKRPAAKMEEELDEAPKEKKNEAKPASNEEQQPGAFGKLTAGQLVKHEAYHNAVRGLKEGQLTEEEFLAMFSHQQRQGMFKMMESSRSENMALKWKAIRGPGTKDKKKTCCLPS